ncbi:MAG: phosphoglycerate kinase [Candidatus ainarchaeum sp.]|nr:phosphoglycerate kinase [Candidatus ainarchaeum sp.]
MAYKFISPQAVKGKTLAVRLDLNSPVEKGKIVVSARLREHAKTVAGLSKKGARLALLSHQGRKGDGDFIPLEQHAKALAGISGKKISFCGWQEDFVSAIKNLKDGEAVLLDNTRFQEDEAVEKSPEEHAKSPWIQKIASVSDFFVEDALSVSHRPHASVVGFAPLLPCFAGPQLEKELDALEKFGSAEPKKRLFILGGAKIGDSLKMIGFLLQNNRAEKILLGGLLGELFLKAGGLSLGERDAFFSEKGLDKLVPEAAEAMQKFPGKIFPPLDVALDEKGKRREIPAVKLPSESMIMDIGKKTISSMKKHIEDADFFVFNGPLGVFEKKQFAEGTKEIFSEFKKTKKTGILGGGDTETAIQALGFSMHDFYHVSLAGKALLECLSGETLPGLEILK